MSRKLLYTASTCSHIVNFHLPYLRQFRKQGWTVHVACGGAPMDIPEADRLIRVPFAKKMTAPGNIACARRLGRLVAEERYDLVITHTALAAFFTRLPLLGRRERPPVINTVHGYLFDEDTPAAKKAVLLSAERLTAPCTDLILTMNETDRCLAERYRLGRRVHTIPGMGVPFGRLDAVTREDGLRYRASLGISGETYLMVYAAEFSARKNQAMLIRALGKLPGHAALLLPGQGALLEECRALARSLGLEGRVYFPGQVSDPSVCYRAADCAVSASRSEGLPFNIMEAMYAALPVVASDVKGHRDLLSGGRGVLYPFGDEAAFAAALSLLMEDADYAAKLGRAAALAAEDYGLARVLPQVLEAYGILTPIKEQETAERS